MEINHTLKQLRNPCKFQTYLMLKLPRAWIMRLRIKEVNLISCVVVLPFKRRNLNPFNSLYFAAQIAAAELSTGLLLLVAINERRDISMLVQTVEASFSKKAVSDVDFICNEGEKITKAIAETIITGEAVKFIVHSQGFDKLGDLVCTANITWSIKRKSKY